MNDAEAVGNTLARLGFDVIRGRDLGRQGMIDRLAEFTARLEAGDTALFFYAGHGVAIGGVNYLVPSDVPAATAGAEARVRGASIAESDIIAEIQAKGARVAVLVLDACRDNPFPRAGTRTLGNTRGLADAKPARGVFTLYSAGIGQTALDRLEPNDKKVFAPVREASGRSGPAGRGAARASRKPVRPAVCINWGRRQGLRGMAFAQDRQDLSPAGRGRARICGAGGDDDAILVGLVDLDQPSQL